MTLRASATGGAIRACVSVQPLSRNPTSTEAGRPLNGSRTVCPPTAAVREPSNGGRHVCEHRKPLLFRRPSSLLPARDSSKTGRGRLGNSNELTSACAQ
ncbi:hypothetical protein V5799_003541 [Amblyomma americanum]|uniref:Uncharacterized protein n=1 Tax=Amblyomma americanum TaxID=6943 RepID=A0AAQ4D8N6_AMBAM